MSYLVHALFSLPAVPLLQEDSGSPFDWGLSPFTMVLIFLLVVFILWLALRGESGRNDLHTAGHEDGHDHHGGHAEDHGQAHAAMMEAPAPAAEAPAAETPASEVPTAEAPAPEAAAPAAATMAAPEPKAAEAPKTSGPDDLTRIEGIGPKVQGVLNAGGIHTFAALAAAEQDTLRRLLDEADYRYMNPGSWPKQAGLAAAGDWEALEKLQDDLKGGV